MIFAIVALCWSEKNPDIYREIQSNNAYKGSIEIYHWGGDKRQNKAHMVGMNTLYVGIPFETV